MRRLVWSIIVLNSFLFGLSDEVLADKYLISAKKHVKSKEYKQAVTYFKKIFNLGIKVPNDMYYFYGKSLKNSGDIIEAYEVFNLYIEKSGRSAKYYQKALGFIVALEDNVAHKKKKLAKEKVRELQRIEHEKIREEKRNKELLIETRIKQSHNNWIFIEENTSTYYGMVSFSKKDEYIALLKIGVFQGVLKYIFSLKKDAPYHDSVRIKRWINTKVEDDTKNVFLLNSGKSCMQDSNCIFIKANYESSIEININNLQDLLLFEKSKFIELDYTLVYESTVPTRTRKYIEEKGSGFTMVGDIKLKDIIGKIMKRKNLNIDNHMVENVLVDYDQKLMWQDVKSVEIQLYIWKDAKKYCEQLIFNNFSNWRLANTDEFKNQKLGSKLLFNFAKDELFWTSTPSQTEESSHKLITDNAFMVWSNAHNDTAERVRCVRDLK